MGGKKKSLANRLAKMSDEERKRYMQHKADQEEEQRRRKEQLINLFLKNKIGKEHAFARLNVAKLNENWHQVLRQIKCVQMKDEVAHVKDYVDRLLEYKDRTIKKLLDELAEAEEQYTNNFQSHLNYVNKMIDFNAKSLNEMREEYDEQIEVLLKAATHERRSIYQAAYEEEMHMKTVLYQFNDTAKTKLRENYDYYFKIADDVIQQNKNEFEEMRGAKEAQITRLWMQIARFLRDHVRRTDVRRAHLAELHTLDAAHAADVARNEHTLTRQRTLEAQLTQRCARLERASETEVANLQRFVDELHVEFRRHKAVTHRALRDDDRCLRQLTAASQTAIEWLTARVEEGEKLLQLAAICRKFETAEEVATRFMRRAFTQIDDELMEPFAEGEEEEDTTPPPSPSDDRLYATWRRLKPMEQFWKRYNKVLLKVMAMRQQKVHMERENEELRVRIRSAMEQRVDMELDERFALYVREIQQVVGMPQVHKASSKPILTVNQNAN